jgi:hypothetical protein
MNLELMELEYVISGIREQTKQTADEEAKQAVEANLTKALEDIQNLRESSCKMERTDGKLSSNYIG